MLSVLLKQGWAGAPSLVAVLVLVLVLGDYLGLLLDTIALAAYEALMIGHHAVLVLLLLLMMMTVGMVTISAQIRTLVVPPK